MRRLRFFERTADAAIAGSAGRASIDAARPKRFYPPRREPVVERAAMSREMYRL